MPGPWDAVAERKLLLCIIDPKATPKWHIIASRMGGQFTGEACRQKYYKLKNESAKLAARSASAPSTPLKPKPGTNKVTKSPASAHIRKRKRTPEVATAEISEPEDEPVPTPQPSMKAIANVPFYKVHKEETKVKREHVMVKVEGDTDFFP